MNDISVIFENTQKALEVLKTREQGIRLYLEIMNGFDPSNTDFRKKFNAFYRVRRNEEWREKYYKIFEELKTNKASEFETVLCKIFNETERVESSFASKMLATINQDMPIWDSRVLNVLGLKQPKGKTPQIRIKKAAETYKKICAWYAENMDSENFTGTIKRFDECFPDYKMISAVKTIDFILWAMPSE